MEKESDSGKGSHFVLVHGAGHGAWSWFKIVTILRREGHRVTAIDLAASGVRPESMSGAVRTFRNYSQPLLDLLASLPKDDERVILVGHSLGGLTLALAMECFPEKISAAVFLTAFMPDSSSPLSSVLEQYFEMSPPDTLLDTQFTQEEHKTIMLFGPKCLSLHFYHNCSAEDLTLGLMLVRPGSLFLEDLSVSPKLSKEKYGSVRRIYVVCKEDKGIPEEFQQWMVKNNPPEEVMEIQGADHMPMLCKPKELSLCLLKIEADSHFA